VSELRRRLGRHSALMLAILSLPTFQGGSGRFHGSVADMPQLVLERNRFSLNRNFAIFWVTP
jgi:hypothetical protein